MRERERERTRERASKPGTNTISRLGREQSGGLGGIGRRVMAEELEKKGNAAFVDEDFEEAVNLYTKALALDSTNASVYISRAAAHVKLENFTGTYA